MPSHARHAWDHDFATRLDQLVRIHADARGRGPGRRWYTETLNQSLFVFLAAQFQAYCRALHVEASEAALTLADPRLSEVMRRLLELGRKLDRNTPRPSVLGNDFALLGINLLPALKAHRPRLLKDLERLDLLVDFLQRRQPRQPGGSEPDGSHRNGQRHSGIISKVQGLGKPAGGYDGRGGSHRACRKAAHPPAMVKGPTAMNNGEPLYREIVEIEWGGYNVRGIVNEVYGLPERRRAVLVLTPELSDCIVAEPTTLSVDLTEIIRIPQGRLHLPRGHPRRPHRRRRLRLLTRQDRPSPHRHRSQHRDEAPS